MAELRRELNFTTLVFLTVNSLIGTGIFFLPALGAHLAGPHSIWSWIIGSAVSMMVAIYFAELVSMFPKAGGVYEFSKQAFGKFTGFLIGWMTWIISNITIAMLIVGSIQYVFPTASILIKITSALLTTFIFNYMSYRGMKLSTIVLFIFGIITIGVLLIIIIPGIPQIELSNFSGGSSLFSLSTIFLTTLFIIETFFGWESTTFLAEETKNPRKVMPKALVVSTAIVVALTLGIVFVSLGVVNWEVFQHSKAPLTDVAQALFGTTGAWIVKILAFLAIIGTAAGWIVTTPRLLMSISRDKMFPSFCEKIHPKYNTPYKSIWLQTGVTAIIVIIALGNYEILLHLMLPLVLAMYSVVLGALVKFKIKNIKSYFKAPFSKIGPLALIIFNLSIIGTWIYHEHQAVSMIALGLLFTFLGIPAYVAIRLVYDKNFKEKFFDWFSYFWDTLFPIWYGEKEQKNVIDLLKLKHGDVVLDYGCYTGITTKRLSDTVGSGGTVVAVDLSRRSLDLAQKKISNKDNVILIKEREIIPFKKNTFDGITLVSVMDHFDDPEKQLKLLYKILKKGKSISVLSFGKVFYLPSPDHLENIETIEKLFKKVGFSKIKIYKKWKLLSEYYFIKATK